MINVTVIMPVFNAIRFLQAAIESVLRQSMENLELVLIDDGSWDGSGEICDRYAALDRRVKAFHQENMGISKARNLGIEEAHGKYITFMDHDDLLKKDTLTNAYFVAESNHADIVKYGYAVEEEFSKGFTEKRHRMAYKLCIIPRTEIENYYDAAYQSGYFNMVWNGLYNREFIVKNGIRFDDRIIQGYEDWKFNCICYPKANLQVLISEIGYIHYQRLGQSTSKRFHKNQLEALMLSAIEERNMLSLFREGMFKKIWNKRSVEYLIEYLFVFKRDGCNLKRIDKIRYLDKAYNSPVFDNLRQEEPIDYLSIGQKTLLKLFKKKQNRMIVFLADIYYPYILLKKQWKKYIRRGPRNECIPGGRAPTWLKH